MKELKAPPAHPVEWKFQYKPTPEIEKMVIVKERTWFAARAKASTELGGVAPETLRLVE